MAARGRYYPAFLDVSGKSCLVVGGGRLALDKARLLLAAGARVAVVAPETSAALRRLKGVTVLSRRFRPADLAGRWLAVAATDDERVNAAVAREAARRRIWANVVDRPALCGFIVPAVVRRGPLVLAVSTGGASPALAAHVGRRLRRAFGPEYARLAAGLRRLRPSLKRLSMDRRKALLARWLDSADPARIGAAAWRKLKDEIRRSAGI